MDNFENATKKTTAKLAKEAYIHDAPSHERKTAVTYTLSPSVKIGIENLAKEHGYPSSSSLVNDILKQIVENNQ